MVDDDDERRGQSELIDRLHQTITGVTHEWDLTPQEICGCLYWVMAEIQKQYADEDDDDEEFSG